MCLTEDEADAVATVIRLELENMEDSGVEIADVEILQSVLDKLKS